MNKLKAALVEVGVLAVIGLTAVGGYQLHWWLRGQEVNRSAEINQGSYGRQVALVEAILNEADDLANPDLPDAQREALIDKMCHNAALLTGSVELPQYAITLIAKECK